MFSFSDLAALFDRFLQQRAAIVDRIESRLLNVRGKPLAGSRDRRRFSQLLDGCFVETAGVSPAMAALTSELSTRHRRNFEPVLIDHYAQELDPLELIPRAYLHWESQRWPGHSARAAYAQAIFSVWMLRQIGCLSLEIWSEGQGTPADRLAEVQRLLDLLGAAPVPGPLVRDARWLLQAAQGTLTRDLRPYFAIADRVSESFAEPDRIEVHRAGAALAGGHLRSQLRYRVWNTGRPADDPELLAFSRNSNSMDLALLVGDLVPLLDAYARAGAAGEAALRLDLAEAILQGLSADPELCLTRLDLLGAYSSIEELFVGRDDAGAPALSALGTAHRARLDRYGELVTRCAGALAEDAAQFDPAASPYSPFGITYGFCSDLLANMALDVLAGHAPAGLSLEDMFVSRDRAERALARAEAWRELPRRAGEREHFDHSLEWAGEMFGRLTSALTARATAGRHPNASPAPDARVIVAAGGPATSADEYCLTTDVTRALNGAAILQPVKQIATDRAEGRFLASAQTSNGEWFAVSKLVLTMMLARGEDARLTAVPGEVVDVMRVTCPELIAAGTSEASR